jgi:peptidyl-prolyl cis-trans isomerase B (cyclophilin B)
MVQVVTALVALFSVIIPAKEWYAPNGRVDIQVQAKQPVSLVLIDFAGKIIEPATSTLVTEDKTVDVREIYPQISTKPGASILLAVPQGKQNRDFLGTPIVIEGLGTPYPAAERNVNVLRLQPLVYTKMTTSLGDMKMLFWYDVAPVTVNSFLSLSAGGFYDGLPFHRIVPNFVVQAGDPLGTGTGGPGYNLPAEFSDRSHDLGVLSMARQGDPLERQGEQPRPDFANSGGSQFFICLTRASTKQLDRRYTAFGMVFDGLETVTKLGSVPLANPASGSPLKAPLINKVQVVPVTAADNPYARTLKLDVANDASTMPTTVPAP